MKINKNGFTLVELMASTMIFAILAIGIMRISEQLINTKVAVQRNRLVQYTISQLDDRLRIITQNSKAVINDGYTCEGRNDWTNGFDGLIAKANSLNTVSQYKFQSSLDSQWSNGTLSVGDKVVAFCDKDGFFNLVGLAYEQLSAGSPKKYFIGHFVKREIKPLISVDGLNASFREGGSVGVNALADSIQLNIGIKTFNIHVTGVPSDYSIIQTERPTITYDIVFELRYKAFGGQKLMYYRYNRSFNMKSLEF